MDDHGVTVGVEDHDLEELSVPSWSNDEQSVVLEDCSELVADGMGDVDVSDPVFPGAVRDLHSGKLARHQPNRQHMLPIVGWGRLLNGHGGPDQPGDGQQGLPHRGGSAAVGYSAACVMSELSAASYWRRPKRKGPKPS